ncbi:hypothetical protein ACPC54_17795 [Kitasatospora sp. NPDC094028]
MTDFSPADFQDFQAGDRIRFLTRDTGFGGRGLVWRTGTVQHVTDKALTVDCDTTLASKRALIRRAAWSDRAPERAITCLEIKPMSMPSALATIAALHTLLTERPELATLPITWQICPDGALHASPPYRVAGSHDAVRALAVAFGFETYGYTVTNPETGRVSSVVGLNDGVIAGAPIYAYGYEPVAAEDGA